MADAGLQAAFELFPESRELILRLADRSAEFRTLCNDLQIVTVHLAELERGDDRREHERLRSELELELSEWLGIKPRAANP